PPPPPPRPPPPPPPPPHAISHRFHGPAAARRASSRLSWTAGGARAPRDGNGVDPRHGEGRRRWDE
ncbi:hypothetical protein, partial [Bifidobacterium choerinum]|uniref:hypothetical protein n=1 Tax=Bifidobacterium choerinum TaxID=35760 RepID=UPI003F918BFD